MSRAVDKASRWMYRGLWAVLVDWFRVPNEAPTLPAHGSDAVDSFQPGEGYLRYLKFYFWVVLFLTDIALFVGWVAACWALWANGLWWVALLISVPWWIVIVLPDILAFIAIHLRFDTTWYVMTDRSLRIRRGIWVIHEVTITFENVQNVRVSNGPVQRYFGIADLIVETAGGGSVGPKGQQGLGHNGLIQGIGNAQELRDRILAKLRHTKTAGLGDEDHSHDHRHHAAPGAGWTREHIEALRAIRDEVRLIAAA